LTQAFQSLNDSTTASLASLLSRSNLSASSATGYTPPSQNASTRIIKKKDQSAAHLDEEPLYPKIKGPSFGLDDYYEQRYERSNNTPPPSSSLGGKRGKGRRKEAANKAPTTKGKGKTPAVKELKLTDYNTIKFGAKKLVSSRGSLLSITDHCCRYTSYPTVAFDFPSSQSGRLIANHLSRRWTITWGETISD
jgi:hypothetical protein